MLEYEWGTICAFFNRTATYRSQSLLLHRGSVITTDGKRLAHKMQTEILKNHEQESTCEGALDPVLLCCCAASSAHLSRVFATTLASETERSGWSCNIFAAKSDKGAAFLRLAVGISVTVSIGQHLTPRGKRPSASLLMLSLP